MRNQQTYQFPTKFSLPFDQNVMPRKMIVGIILIMALFAFEIFNYDTTRFALSSLLGETNFLGIQWAAILAVAFCSIDFAGLVRLFTPEKGMDEPKEVWYLMGAWLLGATMNAVMTWWAVSLTLLNHEFGNEVLSRDQLLRYVPIFVAVLVWLTRILFIGAFTVAGERIFDFSDKPAYRPSTTTNTSGGGNGRSLPATTQPKARPQPKPVHQTAPRRAAPKPRSTKPAPKPTPKQTLKPPTRQVSPVEETPPAPVPQPIPKSVSRPTVRKHSRVRQRPPRPTGNGRSHANGIQARSQQ